MSEIRVPGGSDVRRRGREGLEKQGELECTSLQFLLQVIGPVTPGTSMRRASESFPNLLSRRSHPGPPSHRTTEATTALDLEPYRPPASPRPRTNFPQPAPPASAARASSRDWTQAANKPRGSRALHVDALQRSPASSPPAEQGSRRAPEPVQRRHRSRRPGWGQEPAPAPTPGGGDAATLHADRRLSSSQGARGSAHAHQPGKASPEAPAAPPVPPPSRPRPVQAPPPSLARA